MSNLQQSIEQFLYQTAEYCDHQQWDDGAGDGDRKEPEHHVQDRPLRRFVFDDAHGMYLR